MKIKTSELIGAVDLTDTVCKALRRSWHLGQTYWQQADSESFAQNKKAETTHAAFVALLDDTRAALAAAPAQPVAQQGMAYAALPDEGEPWRGHKFKEVQRGCWRCDCGKTIKEATSDQSTPASGGNYPVMPKRYTVDDDGEELFTAEKMRAFADATHALRASHGKAPAQVAAPAQAGEYPALVCDYCGALTPDPWHSSGMLHGKMSKHIHSCDACCRGAAQAAPAYKDSTPELHIGDSAFENWYSTYSPAHKSDKQRARDAYAAGMGDPLVMAAPAAAAGPSRDLHPEKCPVTGRPFFMTLDHPELGDVPTYGGPYDSYTIPAPEGEPTDPWHERELRSERYDHDAGWWVEGGEPIPLRIVHEDVLFKLQEDAEATAPTTQQAPQQGTPLMPKGDSAAPKLRAMAANYPAGHLWDKLDAQACIRGALEIEALRAAAPSPAAQGDALDAARWRALLACGRIRIIGTAGVTGTGAHDPKALDPNKQPYGNYVHFGAEFWSTFPDQDYYNTKENPAYARATLTEFADAARTAQEGK